MTFCNCDSIKPRFATNSSSEKSSYKISIAIIATFFLEPDIVHFNATPLLSSVEIDLKKPDGYYENIVFELKSASEKRVSKR